MKITRLVLIAAITILFFESNAQMADTKVLGLNEATRIAEAAHKRAMQDNWNVAIAVIDAGGHLVFFRRMDGTQTGSIEVALQKAKTALFYKRPTKVFEDRVAAGGLNVLNLPDMMPFEGGLPIIHNGQVIGAIGVSGVTAQQDGVIAQAGVNAL
jgi:glc operon protein GlcG